MSESIPPTNPESADLGTILASLGLAPGTAPGGQTRPATPPPAARKSETHHGNAGHYALYSLVALVTVGCATLLLRPSTVPNAHTMSPGWIVPPTSTPAPPTMSPKPTHQPPATTKVPVATPSPDPQGVLLARRDALGKQITKRYKHYRWLKERQERLELLQQIQELRTIVAQTKDAGAKQWDYVTQVAYDQVLAAHP